MIDHKEYKLDFREIYVCVGDDLPHEVFINLIDNVRGAVLCDYPEAKNFRVVFEQCKEDTVITLAFERYETEDDRKEALKKRRKNRLKRILYFLIVGVLIMLGCKYYFFSTRLNLALPSNPECSENVLESQEIEAEFRGDSANISEFVDFNMYSIAERSKFIGEFYEHVVFRCDSIELLVNNSTSRLLNELKQSYLDDIKHTYDYEHRYATWCFRTGLRTDGPSDESKVNDIIYLGDFWFEVKYIDMGLVASTKIKFVDVNGKWLMDEVLLVSMEKPEEEIAKDEDNIGMQEETSEDVVGVWCGSSNIGGVVMHEMIEFDQDGCGYYKVDNIVLSFTWKRVSSSMVEFYSSDGTQELKIENGKIIAISANGVEGTIFHKQL